MLILMNKNLNKIHEAVIKKNKSFDNSSILHFEYKQEDNSKKNITNLLQIAEIFNEISHRYPNLQITFTYVKNKNYQFSLPEEETLTRINTILEDRYKTFLQIRKQKELDKHFSFHDVINANNKIDKIVNTIDELSTISTFEKFMFVYEYITDYVYKEDDSWELLASSHWIPVINGDTIVCTGYASLMEELCSRIFSQKEVLILENDVDVYDKRTDELVDAHSNNLIFIKDDKYNIKGLFYLDACMDSIESNEEIKGYAHCCIPLCDISNHNVFYFDFRKVYKYDLNKLYDDFFGNSKRKPFLMNFNFFKDFGNDQAYYNDQSSLHYFINNYPQLHNQSVVPLEAFINAFNIIGEKKGLKGEELRIFTNERIKKSIAKTKYFFNCKNSKSCFALESLKVSKKIIK